MPSHRAEAPLGEEGRTILVVLWILAFLSILACAGRFYLHYFKRDMLGWDFFWIFLCLVSPFL